MKESVMKKEEENKIPFYNLPEQIQDEMEELYGINFVDYLKSLNKEEFDEWLEEN